MKRYLILWFTLSICWSCQWGERVKITVTNPLGMNRQKEIVEVDWKVLEQRLTELTPKQVLVCNADGDEIPSQIIFEDRIIPRKLIFQADVSACGNACYYVKKGKPDSYVSRAYGRYVGERKDDYAWENNLVGHRMYGPALEASGEISNGIDVWVKQKEGLLIDEFYRKGDYHKDNGKGMDAYKVGRTLGAGALAPWYEGNMVLGKNYLSQSTPQCGPLRVCFHLEYAPFWVGDRKVREIRKVTLDADSRFNCIEVTYKGQPDTMEVVAGIVLRPGEDERLIDEETGLMGYWEPHNLDNGEDNGHIAVGVIFPGGVEQITEQYGHLLAHAKSIAGSSFMYYMGTGWSKGGVASAADWFTLLKQEREKRLHPLQVRIENQ